MMDGMEATGGRSASMRKLCGGSLLQEKVGVASETKQFLVYFFHENFPQRMAPQE
jgi:hypothetical protein